MALRPARERSVKDVLDIAKEGLKTSGWDELSLVSLSSSDYSNLEELLFQLNEVLSGQRVAISLPSLRPDAFNESIAENLSKVRKTGLTLAPEAGTQRMRNIINKGVKEEKDRELFIQYLSKDIKLLIKGIQNDSGMLPNYNKENFYIDYELFRELVKKYCYKDNFIDFFSLTD